MPQTSFALLTNVGRAKEAAALANATTIQITQIALGDGPTVPSGGETQLYHEVGRKTISGHGTVAGADNVAYFDCYLAAGDGPLTIREAGLYDSVGDLIAIAHYDPPINKPVPSSGQTVEGTVRLEIAFSNIATVVISLDPSMQVALQRLTRLPWIPIIELNRNAPPASPMPGDTYVIGGAPTGSWAGNGGKVAEFTLAGWAIMTPPAGHGVSLPDGRVYERVAGSYIEKIALDVMSGKWLYAEDTGTAGNVVVALTPQPMGLGPGMRLNVKIAATNMGASTLALTGVATFPIKRAKGGATLFDDLHAGDIVGMVFDGAAWQIGGGATFPRTRLLANLTLCVSTTGNDSNDGQTPATAFRTRQAAYDYCVKNLDLNGFQVTVISATGAYTDALIATGAPVGQTLPIHFTTATPQVPSATTVTVVGDAFGASNGALIRVSGFTKSVSGTNAACVRASYGGIIYLGDVASYATFAFGNCGVGTSHLNASGGSIYLDTNYNVSGGSASWHYYNVAGVIVTTRALTCYLTGTNSFDVFAAAAGNTAAIGLSGIVYDIGGPTFGQKFSANLNAVINTQGQGVNFLPGNVAGVQSNGGLYV